MALSKKESLKQAREINRLMIFTNKRIHGLIGVEMEALQVRIQKVLKITPEEWVKHS